MAQITDIRVPIGGLNSDTEDRWLPEGDYRFAKNARSGTSDQGNVGAVENIRGNTKRDNILPAAGERIVGYAPDVKNNAVVFFVYKSNGQNYIKRYFISTATFENLTNPALMGSVLAFTINTRIYNPRVIDSSFGQLLAWVDYPDGIPNLMNMDKMKQGGIYYSVAADEQYIRLGERPPVNISGQYINVASSANFIEGRFYQFRLRYIYDDNQISSTSNISDVPIPNNQLTKNNAIQLSFNTGHNTVTDIQLIMRQGNGSITNPDNLENPEWYVFLTINKVKSGYSNNTIVTYNFTGEEQLRSVARIDTDKNFESVPQAANALEVTQGTQIVLAGITEGYDNIDVEATITVTYELGLITQFGTGDTINLNDFTADFPLTTNLRCQVEIEDFGTFKTIDFSFGVLDIISFTTFCTRILNQIKTIAPFTTLSIAAGIATFDTNSIQNDPRTISIYDVAKRGMKEFSKVDIGLTYHDDLLRSTGVNIIAKSYEIGSIYQPLTGVLRYLVPILRVNIFSLAPSTAKYYSVYVTESNIQDNYLQTYFENTAFLNVIKLSNPWNFSAGDRVRWVNFDNFIFDYQILKYDSSTQEITIKNTGVFPTVGGGPPIARFNIVELYRINTGTGLFFETSLLQPILSGGLHSGNIQNQTGGAGPDPAIEEFGGQVYYGSIPPREYGAGMSLVSASSFNLTQTPIYPYIPLNYWWKGRVNIETPTQKRQKIGTLIRWSGVLINNTQVNNLSVWDEGNYNNSINARWGDIIGMREVGYTLKIIQQGNYNTAFIGRRELNNANESSVLVVTDQLIGTINPSESELGTKYPGSIIVAEELLYFFDSIKARWVMVANNGDHEVAMITNPNTGTPSPSMSIYWRRIANLLNNSSNYEILTGYDYLYGDLYVTIKNGTANTQESLYYNKDQNRWKYNVDMEYNVSPNPKLIIDWYGGVGQSFFATMVGSLWQFNSLESGGERIYSSLFHYNPLTDPPTPMVVETVGLVRGDQNKVVVFLDHAIHSNLQIAMVEFFIPANAMYPNGMYSRLMPGNYGYKEGVFYANIKRDAFTKGIPVDDPAMRLQIANGRVMRGHVITVRITYETTEFVKLFSTGVGMIPSELS